MVKQYVNPVQNVKNNKKIYIFAVILGACYFLTQNPEHLSFLDDNVEGYVNGALHLVTAVSIGLGLKEVFEKVLTDWKKQIVSQEEIVVVKKPVKKKVARKRAVKKAKPKPTE